MIWNLRKILQHSVTRDVMSQRGKSEFWFTSSFCCYLLKFRFHGQLDLLFESKAVSPVEWSPCCPRTIQPPLTASHVAGSPDLGVLSVSLTSTRSSDPSRLISLADPTSSRLNRMDLPCSH